MISLLKLKMRNALTYFLPYHLIKPFFVFSFCSFARKGLSILTAPLTLALLTPEHYGLIALTNSFISVISLLIGLGLRQSLQVEYVHCTNEKRLALINDTITIYLLTSIPILLILAAGDSFINSFIFINKGSSLLIYVSLLICFLYFFVELFYQLLKQECKASQTAMMQLGGTILTIFLNLFFLCYFKLYIVSIVLAELIGMIIVSIYAYTLYHQKQGLIYFDFRRSIRRIHTYILNGLPFIPSVLFAWLLSSGDRWMLAHYSTIHNVGIYSLANTFSQLFQLLILYPMQATYIPYTLKLFAANPHSIAFLEQKNKRTMYRSMIALMIIVTIAYSIGKSFLYYVLPLHYHEAINYIWFLLIGYIFLCGTYFSTLLIQFYKKRLFMGSVFIIPASINLALNSVLIPYYHLYGCVIATVFSYGLYFYLTLWYNKLLCKKIKH